MTENIAIGLDIGSVFAKATVLSEDGRLLRQEARAHRGEVLKTVCDLAMKVSEKREVFAVDIVGGSGEATAMALGIEPGNVVSAAIAAVQREFPNVRQIIDIGGGSLSLIQLNKQGEFCGYQTNTRCAAGTGSFLDEQAARLGIKYHQLNQAHVANPPGIAARCAVFAKSDLIHRQQEGYSKMQMWSGLCKGLAHTIAMTLFKGKRPEGATALIGGVALNHEVIRWLAKELAVEILIPKNPHCVASLGAAMTAKPIEKIDWQLLLSDSAGRKAPCRPPLLLRRSKYPSFAVQEEYVDSEQNEVRVTRWPKDNLFRGYLGIDVGSTSTKLLMIDETEEALIDVYRKTGGAPIEAVKSLFRALQTLADRTGAKFEILGVGTTGSGRKLVGAVIGADRVINEITAHVTGAMKTDPEIDTIFEIGGQDSKYIHTVGGSLHDSNMNYVCAAGTGSFVEELARKLGFDIYSLGDKVMGVTPPATSDRCTVFMEQDAQLLLRRGYDTREVMGAVMYSIVQNYLNKVVGNRYYSKQKVFFQGATARNKGLVAAFENLLGVEVVVSPYCHVMGSWGVALLTKRQMERTKEVGKSFGLDFAKKKINLTREDCRLCVNRCSITFAKVEGSEQRPSWGYLCGRDPDERRMKVHREYDLFRLREKLWLAGKPELPANAPKIGMPRVLLAYSYYPLWRRFFAELGFVLQLSKKTDRDLIELSAEWVGADYCFPVKLAHGHVRHMLEKNVDRVFLPFMVSADNADGKTWESFFCPYNIGLPAMIRSAMYLNKIDEKRLISATLDLRWDDKTSTDRLYADLGKVLSVSKKSIDRAWQKARRAQQQFEISLRKEGRKQTGELVSGQAIVILGRPYNAFDPGANLALPEKIARLGFPVVPMEFLPLDEEEIAEEFKHMYWNFGRRILEAAHYVARTPNLYAVYFTNFSCGPDSFIQSYVEEIMGEKPMLMLELDEHGADAGYITRLEAFADVIAQNEVKVAPRYRLKRLLADKSSLKDKILWIPAMHEVIPHLSAGALSRAGFNARPLPIEDSEAFTAGKSVCKGGECIPCPATLGAFYAIVKKHGGDPKKHALFMPTAEGPCRFGQYCTLQRIIMDRRGWSDVPLLSWTSTDSYDGIDETTRRRVWSAILLGDILFKMRCRIVPYEKEKGQTEAIYQKWISQLADVFAKEDRYQPFVAKARDEFAAIPVNNIQKPLVGVVGEIYVRCNAFANQNLIRRIEQAGGEAWLAPVSEWILYTAFMESWFKGFRVGSIFEQVGNLLKNRFLLNDEKYWIDFVSPVLDDRHEPAIASVLEEGKRFVPYDFRGEVILTLGRAIEFAKAKAELIVNCAPFGCMPGSISSGVFQRIEAEHSIPVANMFYDGEGDVNNVVDTYLANIQAKRKKSSWKVS